MSFRLRRAALAWTVSLASWVHGAWVYAALVADGGNNHQSADWLINNAGGPIRRGLFGSVYLTVFPSGQVGLWCLYAMQCVLELAVMGWALARVRKLNYAFDAMVVVLGPAAPLFAGWDAAAFGRKEVLALLALIVALTARERRSEAWALGAVAGWAVALLCWEGAVFVLPALCWLVWPLGKRWAAMFAGVGVAATAWSMTHAGTASQGALVCTALRAHGLDRTDLCDGAIAYIGQSTSNAHDYVNYFAAFNIGYLPWVVVALLPLLSARGWLMRHRWLASGTVVMFVAACWVGIDVGRWISLEVSALSICWLARPKRFKVGFGAAVAYLTLWGLPHAPYFDRLWPGLGLVHIVSQLLIGGRL